MVMHFVMLKALNILLMMIIDIYSDIVFCCDVSNYVAIDDGGELTSVHMDHVQKSTGWTTTVTRQAAALTQTWHGLHQIFGP